MQYVPATEHPDASGAGVDRGYGRAVQHQVMVAQDEWCDESEENYEKWEDGRLTASERRVLMTHWVVKAVKTVNEGMVALEKYMGHAGLLMTADGTDDELVKLEGLPPNFKYDFMSANPDPWLASLAKEEVAEEVLAVAHEEPDIEDLCLMGLIRK